MRISVLSLVFLSIVCAGTVSSQSGGTFTITKSVIAGGGGRTSGGTFTLDGTIGQPVAHRLISMAMERLTLVSRG